ncbi:hypothetical protein FKP32DRAFT_1580073, partial [Trametes sanguinea]
LEQHALLLSKLQPRHMSGDEATSASDRLAGIFTIIEAAWQSEQLKFFLRRLDVLYAVEYLKPSKGRLRSGKPPRQRIAKPTSRQADSPAPIGLWRNCYDEAWLARQRRHFIKGLEIIDEDYDFSLDMDALLNRKCDTMEVEEQVEDEEEEEEEEEEEL